MRDIIEIALAVLLGLAIGALAFYGTIYQLATGIANW